MKRWVADQGVGLTIVDLSKKKRRVFTKRFSKGEPKPLNKYYSDNKYKIANYEIKIHGTK